MSGYIELPPLENAAENNHRIPPHLVERARQARARAVASEITDLSITTPHNLIEDTPKVPEHLLERARRAREKLAAREYYASGATTQTDSFLDTKSAALLAEEANGGVCAMAVTNILVELENQQQKPMVVVDEVYDATTKTFVPNLVERYRNKGLRALVGVQTKVVEKQNQPEFIPAATQDWLMPALNGVSLRPGFFHDKFGVLTSVGEERSFIPLVSFIDKRNSTPDDIQCSAAKFEHSLIPCEVQVKEDEKLTLGEFDPETNELRVARLPLEIILKLQESTERGDATTNRTLVERLLKYLNVDRIIADVHELELGRDYSAETYLRKNVGYIPGASTELVLHAEKFDSQQGPSADWVETISFKKTGENTGDYTLRVSYPNARHKRERELATIRLGERLGQISVKKALELNAYQDDDLVKKVADQIKTKPQEAYATSINSMRSSRAIGTGFRLGFRFSSGEDKEG